MKKTIAEKLHSRKLHKPNPVLYWIFMVVIRILNLKTHTHFTYKAHPGKDKGPFVMISNHASRVEYQFMCPPCLPRRLNFVVGYNEFFRFPLSIVVKIMQVIPKKNFTPDLYCAKQIMSIIKQGGCVSLLPEGMSSITGMGQPVMVGSGKLIKKLGVNVYYTKIAGAYLTYTKHCLDERIGKVEVVVDQMFSAEELKTLSVPEIEDRMNRLLAHDDYIWNSKKQISYKGNGQMAKNLDTLLYMCPKCGAMHKMHCEGNTMKCLECGNTIVIDDKYNIKAASESDTCPKLVTDWTLAERQKAYDDVRLEGFSCSEYVKIGTLPKYEYLKHVETSRIVGEGILTLDENGLHFKGNKDGNDFSFDLGTNEVPTFGMCTDITRFYTFVQGEFIEFFPDSRDVLRWDHLVEEMHRYKGGTWQNTSYRHNDDM